MYAKSGYSSSYHSSALPADQAQSLATIRAAARAQRSAGWFFWIAAGSMVNSVLALMKVNLVFMIGLLSTQTLDVVGADATGGLQMMTALLDVILIGGFVGLGILARQYREAAFITGLVLYALDGVLVLGLIALAATNGVSIGDTFPVLLIVVWHAFAIRGLSQGIGASRQYKALQAAEAQQAGGLRTPQRGTSSPTDEEPAQRPKRLFDYYDFLAVHPGATEDEIKEAYLDKVEGAELETVARAERAVALLTNPEQRAAYDLALADNRRERGEGGATSDAEGATGRTVGHGSALPTRASGHGYSAKVV